MASYYTYDDLMKAILKDENVKKTAAKNVGKVTYKMFDEIYAPALKRLIRKNVETYYSSYYPKQHIREFALRGLFETHGIYYQMERTMELKFNEDKAFALNVDHTHWSFLPSLINFGWQVGGRKGGNRFMYFAGSFFITNAVEEFNAMYSKHGIFARIEDL